MPSSTPKQAAFMRAVAHSPQFASKVNVPMKVGKDFEAADDGKHKAKAPGFRGKKTRSYVGA